MLELLTNMDAYEYIMELQSKFFKMLLKSWHFPLHDAMHEKQTQNYQYFLTLAHEIPTSFKYELNDGFMHAWILAHCFIQMHVHYNVANCWIVIFWEVPKLQGILMKQRAVKLLLAKTKSTSQSLNVVCKAIVHWNFQQIELAMQHSICEISR